MIVSLVDALGLMMVCSSLGSATLCWAMSSGCSLLVVRGWSSLSSLESSCSIGVGSGESAPMLSSSGQMLLSWLCKSSMSLS